MSTPIGWQGRPRSGSRLLRAKRRAPLATEEGTDFTESGLPRFGSLSSDLAAPPRPRSLLELPSHSLALPRGGLRWSVAGNSDQLARFSSL